MPLSQPPAIICIGMAGAGKTTFMQRLNTHLHQSQSPPYILNLDPAVKTLPFAANIDIRDSVDYKEVMKQYNLGPNGGIMTCLNLFATKIDQVVGLLEKRAPEINSIIVDTPGQIECFVWSASGAIVTDAIASSFPTVVAYIIDTPRTVAPATFMANMLYACSILYKTKLPMVLVFNKTDVHDHQFAHEWMTDFEAFQAALRKDEEESNLNGGGGGSGSGYMGNLLNSMSLMLEEFYKHLSIAGVSAMTGQGIDDFMKAVAEKADEYEREYKPELEAQREKRAREKEEKKTRELDKLMKDMNVSKAASASASSSSGQNKDKKGEGKVEADVLSDFDEDEDSEAGEMVERDEDESDDEGKRTSAGGAGDEAGLQSRYAQALADNKEKHGGAGTLDEDSFRRYLQANK